MSATSQASSSLLTPPVSPEAPTRPSSHARSSHRRVVSAGALPSLDQIREWSERRTVSSFVGSSKQYNRDEGFDEGSCTTSVEVLVPAQPLAQKRRENRLDKILRARPVPSSRIRSSASVPTTPVVQLTKEISIGEPTDKQREDRATQMVHVLGKRRSLIALRGSAA